jgi:hypothetical protein
VFDNSESFSDDVAYQMTQHQMHLLLADLAGSFVSREAFMKTVAYKVVEGERNTGNGSTQMLKWLVKYHRSSGVHVTPTVFVNQIEASHVSSGWELSQWQELLTPLL